MIEVEEDDNVLLVLDQALGLFDNHFSDLDVARSRLVERRADHFAVDGALHVGDFLGPLVDEQHDQEDFGMIVGDRLGDVLQKHRLTGPRRGDDQCALALAKRRDDVDHARRLVLDRGILGIELDLRRRVERREVVEIDPMADGVRIIEIDLRDLGQCEIALAFLGSANFTFDRVAGAQAEAADDARRDIDVVGAGEIVRFRRAEEAEPVIEDFDRP